MVFFRELLLRNLSISIILKRYVSSYRKQLMKIEQIVDRWRIEMAILVVGTIFLDVKGFPLDTYIPDGRNAGRVEYVHGGVARNVVEDIANVELKPVFLSTVDDTPMGADILEKLKRHKVDCKHVQIDPDGMGMWLAVFDNNGDVAGSISKRPKGRVLAEYVERNGDEIFEGIDSVVLQMDLEKEVVKRIIQLAEKHGAKVYGIISNMSIAVERRDFLKHLDCFICNRDEAGILFVEDYSDCEMETMMEILPEKIKKANIPAMVVTMGAKGSVFATMEGEKGICPSKKVIVKDTTGAGDSFGAGVAIGLTYGKNLQEACEIGTTLAASVITSVENVCPRFMPEELGLDIQATEK